MLQTVLKYIFLLVCFSSILACGSSKLNSKNTLTHYLEKGYTLGIIERKDSGNCGWRISVSENIIYDPINIEEENFIAFSLKKETILFKYLPLRMKNRCENRVPIQLVEIIEYIGN